MSKAGGFSSNKMITKENNSYIITNDFIRAVVLPERGGKISSIRYLKKDFELLFQNPAGNWGKADLGSSFEDFEAAGADDTFPSIDPENVKVGNKEVHYPDHGELWTASMTAESNSDVLSLSCRSRILDYSYNKKIWIDGKSIILSYKIENTGIDPFPAIWTLHALTAVDSDTEIFLPEDVNEVQNAMGKDGILDWEKDERLPYPVVDGYDFRKAINETDKGKCSKFYLPGKVSEGRCGYIYPSRGLRVVINYDKGKLPYLGFWKTIGGFRGDVNIALEPSTGFYDNTANAKKLGCCPIMNPGDSYSFEIAISFEEI